MSKYRKKPVVIEATQWWKHGDHHAVQHIPHMSHDVCNHVIKSGISVHDLGWCPTLEGGHIVNPGDWIITGVKGENYPCKPDIFAATYEAAE